MLFIIALKSRLLEIQFLCVMELFVAECCEEVILSSVFEPASPYTGTYSKDTIDSNGSFVYKQDAGKHFFKVNEDKTHWIVRRTEID